RLAIDREDGLDTLYISIIETIRLTIKVADLLVITHNTYRLRQGFRVIENGFMIEPDKITLFVIIGRINFNGLHLVGPFKNRVPLPALNIGSPGNQHIFIPETNGFAVPTGHIRSQSRYFALHIELGPNMNIGDEVLGYPSQQ